MINTSTANQLLANADLDVTLDDNALAHLLKSTSPQLFVDALRKAANDHGAKAWLNNLLDKARASYRPRAANCNNGSARPAQAHANTLQANNKPGEREFKGHKVFGSTSALYVGVDETRSGTPTVRIEGAVANGPRNFNWENKISIQLTEQELPHVACVLFGWTSQCEYKNHGPEKNKGFKLVMHLKSDYRLNRNHLKGQAGDRANVVLAAAAYNMAKLLAWFYCAAFLRQKIEAFIGKLGINLGNERKLIA